MLRDGRTSASDWTGDWTPAEYPQSIAPAQGFLASANQQPVDPTVERRYLGADWISPWRALRINQLLRADNAVTPDAMRRYQTDPVSAATSIFLPALLAAARRFPDRDSLQRAAALLNAWDGRYTVENTGAVLYQAAIEALPALLWDELDALSPRPSGLSYPAMAVAARLLHDPASPWWDDRRTPNQREDRDALLARALVQGYASVLRQHGAPEAGGWRWDQVHTASISHLLGIPALSLSGIPVQGGPTTLSPSAGSSYGASWRMVVELGPEVRAWGTYPGGQSGNPASPRYQDRIGAWSTGQLDTLRFPRAPGDLDGRVTSVLRLEPAP
jgi:penicillin amidase